MRKQSIVRSMVSFFIGLGLMLPGASFGQTFTISTTARFVDDEVPSSRSNDFDVVLSGFSPGSRTCRVRGLPADRAVNVGNCRWTQLVEGEFALLLITLNWQAAEDAGTPAIFGEFILLNDLGTGQWVRFFTADGTSASVVGSASGSARYTPLGIPSVYTPPTYANTLFVDGAVTASGDGTRSRPFRTISEATQTARPSTAIHIAAGTYTETVRVLKDDIGLFGLAKDAVTISNPGTALAVICSNVNNFTLSSLTVKGKGRNAVGLLACIAEFVDVIVTESSEDGIVVSDDASTASSLTLRNALLSANRVGIVVNHTSSLSAYETTFKQNAVDGVRVTSSGAVLFKECDIVENGRDGLNWKNSNSGTGHLTVADSAISDNGRAGVVLLNAVNGTIERSRVRGNGTSGRFNGLEFERQWTGEFSVSNSTFMNNTQYGIFIGSGSVTLEDNLLEGNGQNGLGIDQAATTRQPITAVLRNNIIRNHPGTNLSDGLGLQLWQQRRDSRPMHVVLDGGNVFDNNATHVSCSSRDNPFDLTCRGNTFYPNFDRAITSCNLNPNICSSVTCPALCY